MKLGYLGVLALLIAPADAPAANREMQELQRDVGKLQDQVKALQNSQNERLTELKTLVQQALDNANRANTGVAVIQSGFQQSLKDLGTQMETKVVGPVVGLSTRMDQMSTDLRTLQGAVSDLTNLFGKLQSQLTDLNNAVKVLQAPPAAPPPAPGAGPGPAAAIDAPTISATDLYNNATRDRSSGKLDLAVQEFSDYLKWYGTREMAPNAQFYIAYIHYSQANYDDALKEFDMVLEKYADDNNKRPDALYYKGMTLLRLGRRTQGAEEFKELLKRYPDHDLSRQACSQLTTMGLRCAAARAAAPTGSRRKQ
ncbi:MAG TPA: tetratricopeptide repeat protein [Candidatus Binataceae bacterium]|nr:tetratricopeptide repeat protein [Candidatus Binataceae bacterium]